MSSWVCHNVGLPLEEIPRAHLQLLGLACKPVPGEVDHASPPAGAVSDGLGGWWQPGQRARHLDSAGRLAAGCPVRGSVVEKVGAPLMVTPKLRLDCLQTGGKNHSLLLPDLIKVSSDVGPPHCACSTAGPPGLPFINGEKPRVQRKEPDAGVSGAETLGDAMAMGKALSGVTKTLSVGRTPSLPRSMGASAINVNENSLFHAHRKVRSLMPTAKSHFCMALPCCRVTFGPAASDETPQVSFFEWPRFITSVVLGGRIEGRIGPPAHRNSQASSASSVPPPTVQKVKSHKKNHVVWYGKSGEEIYIDFKGGPAPKPQEGTVSELLNYLDDSWARKIRGFPAAWSVLWVETLEVQEVKWELRQMRGRGGLGPARCLGCKTILTFTGKDDILAPKSQAKVDKEEKQAALDAQIAAALGVEGEGEEKKEEEPPKAKKLWKGIASLVNNKEKDKALKKRIKEMRKLRKGGGGVPTLGEKPQTPMGADSLTTPWAREVSSTSQESDMAAGLSHVSSPSPSKDPFGLKSTSLSSLPAADGTPLGAADAPAVIVSEAAERSPTSEAAELSLLRWGSKTSVVSEHHSHHEEKQKQPQVMVYDSKEVEAWENGKVTCGRCHVALRTADQLVYCRTLRGPRCKFMPLCCECREALEHISHQQHHMASTMLETQGGANQGPEEDLDPLGEKDDDDEPYEREGTKLGLHDAPKRLPCLAVTGIVETERELCLIAEMELRLRVRELPEHSMEHFLDQLRYEISQTLHIPKKQIRLLRDAACRSGIVQMGLLHPDLLDQHHLRGDADAAPGGQPAVQDEEEEVVDELTKAAMEDIGLLWDRLVLALRGDGGQHRKRTVSFSLLSRLLPGEEGLQWRSAIVVPLTEQAHLMQALCGLGHNSKFEDISDDEDGDYMARRELFSDSEDDGDDDVPDSENDRGVPLGQQITPGLLPKLVRAPDSNRIAPTALVCMKEKMERVLETSLEVVTESINLPDEDAEAELVGTHAFQAMRYTGSRLRPPNLKVKGTFPKVPAYKPDPKSTAVMETRRQRATQQLKLKEVEVLPEPEALAACGSRGPRVHRAVWHGKPEAIIQLLEKVAYDEVNGADAAAGICPVHLAIASCSAEAVRALVERDSLSGSGPVMLEVDDARGRKPIHYAAARGDVDIMSCLVKALGALTSRLEEAELQAGDTPVIIATKRGDVAVLEVLLAGEASANTANYRGLTPLHAAAAAGAVECCEALLIARADPLARDEAFRRPLDWAGTFRQPNIVRMLNRAIGAKTGKQIKPDALAETAPGGFGTVEVQGMVSAAGRGFMNTAPAAFGGDSRENSRLPSRPRSQRGPGFLYKTQRQWSHPDRSPSPSRGRRRGSLGSDCASPTPSPPPEGTRRLRETLLHGQAGLSDGVGACGYWPGRVSSLAVRWRGWAKSSITPQPITVGRRPRELESGLADKMINEGAQEDVVQVCAKLGGFFCMVCCEHVLQPHPDH